MHKPDYDRFRAMLDEHALMFNRDKPDDILVQAYWNSLKDLPWEIVEACGKAHQRFGKFFPKPVELRPRDEKPRQNLPTGEAPRNLVRDYWRSAVVTDVARAYGLSVMALEPIVESNSGLAGAMLSVIDELEMLEKRDGRTIGQHRYSQRRGEEIANAFR